MTILVERSDCLQNLFLACLSAMSKTCIRTTYNAFRLVSPCANFHHYYCIMINSSRTLWLGVLSARDLVFYLYFWWNKRYTIWWRHEVAILSSNCKMCSIYILVIFNEIGTTNHNRMLQQTTLRIQMYAPIC